MQRIIDSFKSRDFAKLLVNHLIKIGQIPPATEEEIEAELDKGWTKDGEPLQKTANHK